MTDKTHPFEEGQSWEEAELAWDKNHDRLAKSHPLKVLPSLPRMPGITPDTAKGLQYKGIRYLVQHDRNRVLPRYFFKHPLKYTYRLIRSLLSSKRYTRDDDFFFYGVKDTEAFCKELKEPKTLLVVGFSYCHKPHECPSGRFTDQCQHDATHPVCGQCFIGKMVHALPKRPHISQQQIQPLFIPTIHYIGEQLFRLKEEHPDRKLLFIITACEMTLEMFGSWGNMIKAQGIGVRLDGRICNTMRAFELSEEGIKPGLTVVLPHTQQRLLALIRQVRSNHTRADDGMA